MPFIRGYRSLAWWIIRLLITTRKLVCFLIRCLGVWRSKNLDELLKVLVRWHSWVRLSASRTLILWKLRLLLKLFEGLLIVLCSLPAWTLYTVVLLRCVVLFVQGFLESILLHQLQFRLRIVFVDYQTFICFVQVSMCASIVGLQSNIVLSLMSILILRRYSCLLLLTPTTQLVALSKHRGILLSFHLVVVGG